MASNDIFNVNGEGEDRLKVALALAFSGGHHKARAWSIDKEKGLILYWHEEHGTALPTPMSAEEVFPIVWAFLNGDKAKEIACAGWDQNEDHDGSNHLGWRVYTEDWGQINEDFYAFLAIKPAYLWFCK